MKQLSAIVFSFIVIATIFPVNIVGAKDVTILMTKDGFEPKEVTIQKNDAIIFENEDAISRWPASNIHPTHEIYSEFDPKQGIEEGSSWSFVFNKAGTWKFHDHIFPQFSGTITVEGENDAEIIKTELSFWNKIKQWFAGTWYHLIHWGKATQENETTSNKKYNLDIEEGDENIFNNNDALGSHLQKYGVQKTITALRLMEPKFGSCHQPAHKAGRMGYEIFGNKAFIEYSAECQSGYYHGAMEGYFKKYNSGNLADSLDTLCQGGTNSFFEHQCVHGIGHGIMAWTNYELTEALSTCDQLPKRQDSCWTGVFMENFVAKPFADATKTNTTTVAESDIHYTKYLNDDPQYPCTIVDSKYKSSCYFLQTSRMLQIFGVNFQKIADSCGQAPSPYQNSCFASMGRDVGGSFPKDMAREIKECNWVKNEGMRLECLGGAVQNSFWDPSGQDLAIEFCGLLTNTTEKSRCYDTIFGRAPEIIFNKLDLENFCKKSEPEYQYRCQ